jgi:isocitrate lyase
MRILPLLLIPTLSGCVVGTIASTAVDVVTLPVKAVSAGVDAATTSQSEADQKRGRELREQEERRGKALRRWEEQCRKLTAAGQPCPPPPAS